MNNSTAHIDALSFLQAGNNLTAVLATTNTKHIPHAATVYYAVDDALHFYFLTATNTTKYKNLQTNNQVALVVGFGPDYTTIQGHGTAELLPKSSTAERTAISIIKKRLVAEDYSWPIFQLIEFERESIAVFEFIPTSLLLLNLERHNGLTYTADKAQTIL